MSILVIELHSKKVAFAMMVTDVGIVTLVDSNSMLAVPSGEMPVWVHRIAEPRFLLLYTRRAKDRVLRATYLLRT